ncbi:MAG: hypothetical protein LBU36_04370 [Clostridiales bacterium]|jgi:hypothetical protein|nr:hypothetical protein [Clostridiales bacterium]
MTKREILEKLLSRPPCAANADKWPKELLTAMCVLGLSPEAAQSCDELLAAALIGEALGNLSAHKYLDEALGRGKEDGGDDGLKSLIEAVRSV